MTATRKSLTCPYCGSKTKIISGDEIKALRYINTDGKQVLVCCNYPTCDSYTVFPERSLEQPGIVADKHLRQLRNRTHHFIDIIGITGILNRTDVYEMLSVILDKPEVYSHVRYYDADDCIEAILFACEYIYDNYGKIKSYNELNEKQLHILHCLLDSEFTEHYNSEFTSKDLKNALSCIYNNEDISIFSVSLKHKTCTVRNRNTRATTVFKVTGENLTDLIKDFNKTLYNTYIERKF